MQSNSKHIASNFLYMFCIQAIAFTFCLPYQQKQLGSILFLDMEVVVLSPPTENVIISCSQITEKFKNLSTILQ
jgi:hypothetical protein